MTSYRRARSIIIYCFTILLCQIGFAQVVIDKQIVESSINCRQFDVTLSVTGNPGVQALEVVLLIDNSGSMSDVVTVDGVSKTLLEFAQEAAIDFVNNVFDSANDPNQRNKVAIVSYNSFANIEIGLTGVSGQQDIINQINSIVAGGSTNMQDALLNADAILTSQGTFDCNASRNIILLTDGVARWHNGLGTNVTGAGQCNDLIIDTDCQTTAFTAATNAETTVVGGETFNQQIFTVGFTGTLNANQLAVSEHSLNSIQNSGAFFTDDAADLTDIYNTILGQLVSAATPLEGRSLVEDLIAEGFQVIPNSITTNKGSFSVSDQKIDWFVERVLDETVSLNYSMTALEDQCGISDPGTSTINFEDSNCNVFSEVFENPEVCVPCPETTIQLLKSGCKSIDFSSSVNQFGCMPTSENYSWKFFLEGVEIGTSNESSGTFTYTGTDIFLGTFTAELDYQGFYNACENTLIEDSANLEVNCSSDLSLQTLINKALPIIGDTVTYTIIVKNNGPQDASGIEITNVFPLGLNYSLVNFNVPSGTSFDEISGVWDLKDVVIANGDSINLDLSINVITAGSFVNLAEITRTVKENDIDSTPSNNN